MRIGFQLAQPRHPFRRLPIGDARVVQPRRHHQRRIGLRAHLIIGRIAADQFKRGLVLDGIAPFGPFTGGERQGLVEHRRQHIDKGDMRHHRAPQSRVAVDHRPHQLAAGGAARDADPPLGGDPARDQPPRHIDEIIEGIGALLQLAALVPRAAHVVAAPDMRDGIGKAPVHQRQPRGGKPRRNRDAIGAVAIQMQRSTRWPVAPHHHADRHQSPVARGDFQPLGCIQAGVVTAGDFLHLQHFEAAVRNVVIIDGGGADHAFIGQAQPVHRPFGVLGKAGVIAGLGEGDRFDPCGIVVVSHLDLIQPAHPPLDHVKVAEQFKPGEVKGVRALDQRGPFAGPVQRRGGKAEVLVRVVGVDEQRVVPDIDFIFDARLTRAHQHRRRQGIGGRDQA